MERTLPSGARFDVTPLPYEEAWDVTQSIMRVAEKLKVDLSGLDLENLGETDVTRFSGPIFAVLSSPDVLASAKRCWARCTYNGLKIDKATFDDTKARGDFLFCAFYALQENLAPFFAGALSFFGMRFK